MTLVDAINSGHRFLRRHGWAGWAEVDDNHFYWRNGMLCSPTVADIMAKDWETWDGKVEGPRISHGPTEFKGPSDRQSRELASDHPLPDRPNTPTPLELELKPR